MKKSLIMAATLIAAMLTHGPASNAQANESPQSQLDAIMALHPGGVQVSDNAVVWGDGDVVFVVPDAGSKVAARGLGSNIRADRVRTPALKALAKLGNGTTTGTDTRESSGSAGPLGAAWTCPHGVGAKDYYCFYQYSNFNGRRVQFTGATSADYASNWGFNNGTTSWASWDVDWTVRAYDYAGGPHLWTEVEKSSSSHVGSTNDNRLSYWTCTL